MDSYIKTKPNLFLNTTRIRTQSSRQRASLESSEPGSQEEVLGSVEGQAFPSSLYLHSVGVPKRRQEESRMKRGSVRKTLHLSVTRGPDRWVGQCQKKGAKARELITVLNFLLNFFPDEWGETSFYTFKRNLYFI